MGNELVVLYYPGTLRNTIMSFVKNKIDFLEDRMNTAHFDQASVGRPNKHVPDPIDLPLAQGA